jgi:hypothetical protein
LRGLILVFVFVLALGGCGGSDEESVEGVVRAYLDAFAEQDGDAACEHLNADARLELYLAFLVADIEEAQRVGIDADADDDPEEYRRQINAACPRIVEKVTSAARGSELESLRLAEVADVRVEGDRAFVRIEGASQVPTLVKEDGEWRISDLGIDPGQL